MMRNDAGANVMSKNKKDAAVKALEQLVSIPVQDVNELMDLMDKGDLKGARRAAKRIRRRIHKYGI